MIPNSEPIRHHEELCTFSVDNSEDNFFRGPRRAAATSIRHAGQNLITPVFYHLNQLVTAVI
jgi:hypothetical protein